MDRLEIADRLGFTSSATYQILVKGFLDESWAERLNGMTIVNKILDAGPPVTKLQGQVRDQAELLGRHFSKNGTRFDAVYTRSINNPSVAAKVIAEFTRVSSLVPAAQMEQLVEPLSERELEILQLLVVLLAQLVLHLGGLLGDELLDPGVQLLLARPGGRRAVLI